MLIIVLFVLKLFRSLKDVSLMHVCTLLRFCTVVVCIFVFSKHRCNDAIRFSFLVMIPFCSIHLFPLLQTDQLRQCRARYDCVADNLDELSFRLGDIIVITQSSVDGEDDTWMVSCCCDCSLMHISSRRAIYCTIRIIAVSFPFHLLLLPNSGVHSVNR